MPGTHRHLPRHLPGTCPAPRPCRSARSLSSRMRRSAPDATRVCVVICGEDDTAPGGSGCSEAEGRLSANGALPRPARRAYRASRSCSPRCSPSARLRARLCDRLNVCLLACSPCRRSQPSASVVLFGGALPPQAHRRFAACSPEHPSSENPCGSRPEHTPEQRPEHPSMADAPKLDLPPPDIVVAQP